MAKHVTSADMRRAIRERFGKASAVFDEVGNSTGARCSRHADVVAMGLWPSRGLHLEGIEIKVSRSDWLAELRNPEKADDIAKYCDFWWLAIGDASIVQDGELPANWGLLVLDGDKLKTVKQAPKLEALPLDRAFVAALLRRASEAQEAIRRSAHAKGREEGIASAPAAIEQEKTAADHELENLRTSIAQFEEASGIKIEAYNGGHLGELVAKLQKLNQWRHRRQDPAELLDRAAATLEQRASDLREEGQKLAQELKLVTAADRKAALSG